MLASTAPIGLMPTGQCFDQHEPRSTGRYVLLFARDRPTNAARGHQPEYVRTYSGWYHALPFDGLIERGYRVSIEMP